MLLLPGAVGCRSLTRLKALRLRGFSADDDDDNDEEDDASSRNRDVIQVPCAPGNAGPAMGAAATADPCLSVTPRDGADIERNSAFMSLTVHPEPREPGLYHRAVRETTDATRKTFGPPEYNRVNIYIHTHTR